MLGADSRPALVEVASAPACDGQFLDAGDCRDFRLAERTKKKPAEAGQDSLERIKRLGMGCRPSASGIGLTGA